MEKALQMSMGGEPTTSQDSEEKPLTNEEFDKKMKVYTKNLISLLVQVSDTTLIDRSKALDILTRGTKFPKAFLTQVIEKINDEASFEQLEFSLQLCLAFLYKAPLKFRKRHIYEIQSKIGEKLLSQPNQALFYLCLLLLKKTEQ